MKMRLFEAEHLLPWWPRRFSIILEPLKNLWTMLLVLEISSMSQMTQNMWRPSLVSDKTKHTLARLQHFSLVQNLQIHWHHYWWRVLKGYNKQLNSKSGEISFFIFYLSLFLCLPLAKCIDHYTKLRVENAELPEDEEKKSIDPRLEGIVNKMFLRCLDDHKYKQAIGIALETRRLDMFEKTILESVSIAASDLLLLLLLLQNARAFFPLRHC